ncbi:hypothetical protein CcCBS67573_g05794 [Chytriomyces confervae]|uniref:Uncharacterized protein n=1 Tax=Chytriomyces confervae TaxID=246404 RepID=A0A507FAB5_9FUNG|nr:hypothetical protein HDU80_005966 [Chytriomyces hyalinus]TPX72530.1 hypothetical protein CcCBS67573_g05794 [Chytriomyces confervae]
MRANGPASSSESNAESRDTASNATDELRASSPQRHRLLPTLELPAIARRTDSDDDWDDAQAIVPVLCALAAVISLAFVLWPIVSFDPAYSEILPGSTRRLIRFDNALYSMLVIDADNYMNAAYINAEQIQDEDAANSNGLMALAHVFYNNPPVAIPAEKSIVRNLDITLDNSREAFNGVMQYQFAALRWDVIGGGNITVEWDLSAVGDVHDAGLAPSLTVMQGQVGFDLWRRDATGEQTQAFRIHSESSYQGRYEFSNQPTESYYFIFATPSSFWSFKAAGMANFTLNLMEYDVSGTHPNRPKPLIACEFPRELKSSGTPGNSSLILGSKPRLKHYTTILNELLKASYNLFNRSHPQSKHDQINSSIDSNSQRLVFESNDGLDPMALITDSSISATSARPRTCRIPFPDPKFISQVYIVLTSPKSVMGFEGGSGLGNQRNPLNNPAQTDSGTLDPYATTAFHLDPNQREGTGASPVWFFIWAFSAVIGISVGVALGIFAVVWVLGWAVQVVFRWLGWEYWLEGRRRGDDPDDNAIEPLPLYQERGEAYVEENGADAVEEISGRMPPEYSVRDALLAHGRDSQSD